MTIKMFLSTTFLIILTLAFFFNLKSIKGLRFQETHDPIEFYSIIKINNSSSFKSSTNIVIKFKGKKYTLEVSKKICSDIENNKIKPKIYYIADEDCLFYEGWYFNIAFVYLTYFFLIFPLIGLIVYRKELNNHYSTM